MLPRLALARARARTTSLALALTPAPAPAVPRLGAPRRLGSLATPASPASDRAGAALNSNTNSNTNANATAATPAPDTDTVTVTSRALDRVRALRAARNDAGLRLRLAVEGGGCSGFSYKFSTTSEAPSAEDRVFGEGGALLVDAASLEFVRGARVDYTEDLIRRSFEVVDNPQSETRCGCGASFSPKA